jgi:N-acetylglutamate synthase-like GNAT family acetyltransferase
MGIQGVQDATLIRHAYVRSAQQHHGIGGKLLKELVRQASAQVLVGTWAAAEWAIRFYQRHGFQLVPIEEKNRFLRKYWNISQRQQETSVVLALPVSSSSDAQPRSNYTS